MVVGLQTVRQEFYLPSLKVVSGTSCMQTAIEPQFTCTVEQKKEIANEKTPIQMQDAVHVLLASMAVSRMVHPRGNEALGNKEARSSRGGHSVTKAVLH